MKITTSTVIIDNGRIITKIPLTPNLSMEEEDEDQRKYNLILINGKYYELDNSKTNKKGFIYNKGIFKTL
jgi:hypothetical protein